DAGEPTELFAPPEKLPPSMLADRAVFKRWLKPQTSSSRSFSSRNQRPSPDVITRSHASSRAPPNGCAHDLHPSAKLSKWDVSTDYQRLGKLGTRR
ncbi:hypothetical protein, partial [Mesorhizobium sp.]|uniref:hypothetical protein n=1 Tax=Mesorhizobium sp. TaxID=1871066 RepID=UPI0025EBAAC9